MSIGEEAARLAEAVPQVAATTATFAGIDGERARLLDEAGQAVFASKATADWPAVGDMVWLLTVGEHRLMLGAPSGSPWGRVSSVGTGTAIVEYPLESGELATFATPRGLTPVVGDLVQLEHSRALILAAWETATEPTPTPTPVQPGTSETRAAEVNVAWDGSATPAGYWITGPRLYTRNVSGGPNYATVGYGDRVTRLGIDPASIVDAAIYLNLDALGSAHTGGTHTLGGRSGVPSPANTFPVQPKSGWLTIPLAAARALADGSASGLTFYGGTGTVLFGVQANPGNGRLRLRYSVEV